MTIIEVHVTTDGVHHVLRSDGKTLEIAGDDPERDAKIIAFGNG